MANTYFDTSFIDVSLCFILSLLILNCEFSLFLESVAVVWKSDMYKMSFDY